MLAVWAGSLLTTAGQMCVFAHTGVWVLSEVHTPSILWWFLPGSDTLCSFGHHNCVLLWKPKKFRRGFCLLFPSIAKAISRRCQWFPAPVLYLIWSGGERKSEIIGVPLQAAEPALVPTPKGRGRESRKARTNLGEPCLGTEVDKDAKLHLLQCNGCVQLSGSCPHQSTDFCWDSKMIPVRLLTFSLTLYVLIRFVIFILLLNKGSASSL